MRIFPRANLRLLSSLTARGDERFITITEAPVRADLDEPGASDNSSPCRLTLVRPESGGRAGKAECAVDGGADSPDCSSIAWSSGSGVVVS